MRNRNLSLMPCGFCRVSWVFIRIQGFTPSDPALFNQLVTALSKSLAHQAHVAACHKRREFYLSHLPAYVTDATKRSFCFC